LRVTSITSQAAIVNRTIVRERLLALLAGFFALVGLVLTAVGLYGTLSYAVVQSPLEASSLALPLGALLLAVLGAAAVPAWRAAPVDPVIALRNE
jgi:ABC-type antimicrobial peptide transport system permease subunit